MSKALSDLLERARHWPKGAQDELAHIAREIESELGAGTYTASDAEHAGIDRGLKDAADGRFASDDEVNSVFAKPRR